MQSLHQRTLFQLANIFHDSNHEFNRDAVFIINEEIKNSQKTKQEKRILLMKKDRTFGSTNMTNPTRCHDHFVNFHFKKIKIP